MDEISILRGNMMGLHKLTVVGLVSVLVALMLAKPCGTVPPTTFAPATLNLMSEYLDRSYYTNEAVALAMCAMGKQLTWIVPLAEYWVAGSKRPLVPEEQNCQTYLAQTEFHLS
jgi:hypothetical protein